MLNGIPERVEENWGVELDDLGSVEYMNDEDTARAEATRIGARLVKIVHEFYDPEVT